jgi:hypothetical protein
MCMFQKISKIISKIYSRQICLELCFGLISSINLIIKWEITYKSIKYSKSKLSCAHRFLRWKQYNPKYINLSEILGCLRYPSSLLTWRKIRCTININIRIIIKQTRMWCLHGQGSQHCVLTLWPLHLQLVWASAQE